MTVRMCLLAVGFRTKWSVGHPIDMHREVAGRQFRVHVAAHTRRVAGSGDLFRAARRMGLEGLVSKRRDRPYQSGRSKHWIKVKNRKHPAMSRVMEAFA